MGHHTGLSQLLSSGCGAAFTAAHKIPQRSLSCPRCPPLTQLSSSGSAPSSVAASAAAQAPGAPQAQPAPSRPSRIHSIPEGGPAGRASWTKPVGCCHFPRLQPSERREKKLRARAKTLIGASALLRAREGSLQRMGHPPPHLHTCCRGTHLDFWGPKPPLPTWSTTNSVRSRRRLPALVATGTVSLMVTPSTGKKPRFCSCEDKGQGWGTGDGQGDHVPARDIALLYLEGAVEGGADAVVSLQGAVGFDFVVVQAGCPVVTEEEKS